MKISIITASYNYAQYIVETIDSVISQTYQDWELIVVDDGSSDGSVDIIKSYCGKDSRIKFFQHQNGENRGLKETILLGLENSTGDWVAFLESDDFFLPENLAKKVEVIKNNPSVKLVFNKVEFLWDEQREKSNNKRIEKRQNNLSNKKFPRNMFYDFYLRNQILTFSSVIVEKNFIKQANFNTPIDALLDWWLWVHLAQKSEFYYLDECLTIWRLHAESYIEKAKQKQSGRVSKEAYMKLFAETHNIKILFYVLISEVILEIINVGKMISEKLAHSNNKDF